MTFDLKKPVQTRSGKAARIICTNRKGGAPVVALITDGPAAAEYIYHYGLDGILWGSSHNYNDYDLVNIKVKKWKWVIKYVDGVGHFVSGNHFTEIEANQMYQPGLIVGRIQETEIEE